MAETTLDGFMARYNPGGEHEVIRVAATQGSGNSPFIVISDGTHTVIVNPLAFDDHLSVDVHPFIDGNDASGGVFGMTSGRRWELPETGETSHGWPAVRLVTVIVGDQA